MSICDIVIPVWNQLEDTKECVESIERNTLFSYRLVIVDNGSGEKTAAYLRALAKRRPKRLLLIRNEKNEGFVKAVNKGISLSKAEFVCILNNDTLVTSGWLKALINVIKRDASIGIVNPSSNTLGQRLSKGKTLRQHAEDIKDGRGLFVETGSAFGFCMLARRKLFDEIGLLDTAYGLGNFDDTDLSLRAKKNGYKTVRAFASYVHHKEQRSFNLLKRFKSDFAENRRIFEAKWGRTKRAIVVVRDINPESLDCLEGILKKHTGEKSWVYIISPEFDTIKFFERYSNLTFYHFNRLFYTFAFLKILFKKKRPDFIYSDNAVFSHFLGTCRVFRAAETLRAKKRI